MNLVVSVTMASQLGPVSNRGPVVLSVPDEGGATPRTRARAGNEVGDRRMLGWLE
jgi:hypothetical protein